MAIWPLNGSQALGLARQYLDDSRAIAQRQGAVALELRTLIDRFELERDHGDPRRWRDDLAELVAGLEGQRHHP